MNEQREKDLARPPEGPGNFVREIVAADVAAGKNGGQVVTRFPPEPNGYPHLGHLKAICINFGIAEEFGGRCHLRLDDTNPETEDEEYVRAFERDIRWLGFDWGENLFFASDYFDRLYEFAQELIRAGKAFTCSQSEAEMREYRGTITEAGRPSPYRERSPEESLDLFERMKRGEFPEGAHVVRAKIDMASPNMKMRDPAIYRIRHQPHYRTGNRWHVYPLYDFAHCLSDAIEGITHSLCSHEFENNRELYDWFIDNLSVPSRPRQYEFGRFNVAYTITSKRKLRELIELGHVSGWDDPRMPTVAAFRRRGYPPSALRNLMDRTGVSRTPSTVDLSLMEYFVRDALNPTAKRVLCVLDPLKVTLVNYDADRTETVDAPYFPPDVGREGSRPLKLSREIFVERSDFADPPPPKWHRLAPGARVRLRHAYVIRCQEVVKDNRGRVVELRCEYEPGSAGAAESTGPRVRGTIHWVSASAAVPCEVRLYERLFTDPEPVRGKDGPDFKTFLNPHSLQVVSALVEESVTEAQVGDQFQFERHGFFVVDPDSSAERPVFNRTVSLRDSWSKIAAADGTRTQAGARAGGGDPERRKRKADKASKVSERAADAPGEAGRVAVELSPEAQALQAEGGLTDEQARLIAREPGLSDLFREARRAHDSPKTLANWITTELLRELKGRSVDSLPFGGRELGGLVELLDNGAISSSAAKQVFAEMLKAGGSPAEIVKDRGLGRIADDESLAPVVESVLAAHADHVEKYRAGQHGLLGALVGRVMQSTGGRADAKRARELLLERLRE